MTATGTTRCLAAVALLGVLLPAGCGGAGDGPPRHELSGKITYQSGPIPGGRILFVPDTDRGNRGPGTVAQIHDGTYRTRPGKGTVGGPHRLTVFGTNGKMATETEDNCLFAPYTMDAVLPQEDASLDIRVPAGGAAP